MARYKQVATLWIRALAPFGLGRFTPALLLWWTLLFFGVGSLLFGCWLWNRSNSPAYGPQELAIDYAHNLKRRHAELVQAAKSMAVLLALDTQEREHTGRYEEIEQQLVRQEGGLIMFKHDTVCYWSTSYCPEALKALRAGAEYVEMASSWYHVAYQEISGYTVANLVKVCELYAVHNEYVSSRYARSLQFLNGRELPELSKVLGRETKTLSEAEPQGNAVLLLSCLLLLGMLLLLPRTWELEGHWISVVLVLGASVLLRWAYMRSGAFTGLLSQLFSPRLVAVSFLMPSLGDFLLHTLLLLGMTLVLLRYFKAASSKQRSRMVSLLLSVLVSLAIVQWGGVLVRQLVLNSTLTIPPFAVTAFSVYVLVAYVALACWFASGVIMLGYACSMLQHRPWVMVLLSAFLVLSTLLMWHISQAFTWEGLLLYLLVFVMSFIPMYLRKNKFLFRGFDLMLALVLSLYVSVRIYRDSMYRDGLVQAQLAERVVNLRDGLLEVTLPELETAIEGDTVLAALASDRNVDEKQLAAYFEAHFPSGCPQGYQLRLRVLPATEDSVRTGHTNATVPPLFPLAPVGDQVENSAFYSMPHEYGRVTYCASIPLGKTTSASSILQLELSARLDEEPSGYQALLQDNRGGVLPLPKLYSLAVYKDKNLVYHVGQYNYSNRLPQLLVGKNKTVRIGDYAHHSYPQCPMLLVIVSRPEPSFPDLLGLLTYSAMLFALVITLAIRASYVFPLKHLMGRGIVGRLQLYTIGQLFGVLLLALLTSLYIYREVEALKNKNALKEKFELVHSSLRSKLPAVAAQSGPGASAACEEVLEKIAQRYRTDAHIYNLDGELCASSFRPIFTQGLLCTHMSPNAWYEMHLREATSYIEQMTTGSMHYLAEYAPLRVNGQLMGYLCVPYFIRPGEFSVQYTSLMTLLLDFFAVLLAVSLLLSFVLAQGVFKPLVKLRKSVQKVSIRGRNEPIFYDTQDQLGALFAAYNRMLEDLERSAQELAESERQSAWREMARQIAHDIKNPLTPIRLNLQRVVQLKAQDDARWPEAFDRFAVMMEAQIDQLAQTASSFSVFSRLAEGRAEPVLAAEEIDVSIGLFSTNDSIAWEIDTEGVGESRVWMDRNNLQRLLNNILSNAVQAVSASEEPRIRVLATQQARMLHIEIQDNGSGIPAEFQPKLFRVSFTTKSSGNGLGLTIVKAIIDAVGGHIRFSTAVGVGTTFYIDLPLYQGPVTE